METLNDYIKRLQTALEKKRPYVTYNRDKYHASLVVSAGFRHAEESIRIVSHKLDPDVYDSPALQKSVKRFLSKANTTLSILIEEEVDNDHAIFQIGREYDKRVTIKKIPSYLQKKYECNFMLIDSFGYRFEPDRSKYYAMVAFHDDDHRDMITTLKRLFHALDSRAEHVTLSEA